MVEEKLNMAQYTGVQSIIDAALGDYQSKGFRLVETDDHNLTLYYHAEQVVIISQSRSTIQTIHEACREYLESLSAG